MDDITAIVLDAMEQAGISGLCREGQVEFAVGEAHRQRPDVSRAVLLELAQRLGTRSRPPLEGEPAERCPHSPAARPAGRRLSLTP
jgi:hypothetical protein